MLQTVWQVEGGFKRDGAWGSSQGKPAEFESIAVVAIRGLGRVQRVVVRQLVRTFPATLSLYISFPASLDMEKREK